MVRLGDVVREVRDRLPQGLYPSLLEIGKAMTLVLNTHDVTTLNLDVISDHIVSIFVKGINPGATHDRTRYFIANNVEMKLSEYLNDLTEEMAAFGGSKTRVRKAFIEGVENWLKRTKGEERA